MFSNELYVYGDQNVQVPAHLNFGKYMLDRLRRMKEEIAIENASTGESMTYREVTQYAVDLAVSLIKLGVRQGDIVGFGSETRLKFVPTILGIIFSGATFTPCDLECGRAVLRHKVGITQPKYFICSSQFWQNYKDILETFESIKSFITLDEEPKCAISLRSLVMDHVDVNKFEPPNVRGQTDIAIILYSSGTTGMPKGVKLSHLNCILNSLPHDYTDESLQTAFVCGEWYHNYDSFMTYKFLSVGRKIVYTTWKRNSEKLLESIEKCRVNIAFVYPSTVNELSKMKENKKYNISSLKTLYSRSSPLHATTIERLKLRFPSIDILQGYGMTEAGELTSENWGSKGSRPGSAGKASPGITLKVVDPSTQEVLGPNQRGEICLRGPVFMNGYIGVDPSSYLDEDGFFRTGDLGYYDEDGYFYVVDRLKEIIVVDGNKVAPLEIETILLSHPGVKEAGVVGKPASAFVEQPTAFVIKEPGYKLTEKELVDFVAGEVSPAMQLTGGVKFVAELPRNPRGKLLRRALKEMF